MGIWEWPSGSKVRGINRFKSSPRQGAGGDGGMKRRMGREEWKGDGGRFVDRRTTPDKELRSS